MNGSAIPDVNARVAHPDKSSLYDPLVLFAETVIPTDSSAAPNTAALKNPHSMPMELLAVKFRIHTMSEVAAVTRSVSGLGVGVKMDMGKIQLVDANVPVSLMSTARDDSEDGDLGYPIWPQPGDVNAATAPVAKVYEYLWRLRYPLFIPPGAVIVPLFSHLTQTPLDVAVGVTYYCRTFRKSAKTPSTVHVPWVTSYKSKSFEIASGTNAADSDKSTELDIRNPFPTGRVEIARIAGRANFYVTSSGLVGGFPNTNYENSLVGSGAGGYGYADQLNEFLRVTIRGSRGDDIVPNPTLFGSLFPSVFKTWEIAPGWFMYPGEFYDVDLMRQEFTGPLVATDAARMQVAIGVTGYQKIDTRTLEGAL